MQSVVVMGAALEQFLSLVPVLIRKPAYGGGILFAGVDLDSHN